MVTVSVEVSSGIGAVRWQASLVVEGSLALSRTVFIIQRWMTAVTTLSHYGFWRIISVSFSVTILTLLLFDRNRLLNYLSFLTT